MSTVLVTGCAGFIASRTAEFLLERGDRVVGIDNMNDYYDVRLKEHRLEVLRKHPGFEYLPIDIESEDKLLDLFKSHKFDSVLNLAARAGVRYSMEFPHVYFMTNTVGTLNLLEMCRHHEVKKFVLASTSSLYAGQKMPFVETLPVNTPISPYAASKKGAEVTCYTYHNLFDIDVTIVRYFTVFGPSGRPDMSVFRFIKWIDQGDPIQLFGDGTQSRDFTYIDDIARGTIAAMAPVGYEIVNMGGGNEPVTINWVIEELEQMLGKKAEIDYKPFHKADMACTWADVSKAKRLFGWETEVSVKEGLQRSVDWYQENIEWCRELKVI